ncbi:18996_t:CDS:2 [Dentiscutata erythropus]|uniref:18996_t:CDS:1 n=1 Tax=Dentiscutata erythropus TaxID=1348616 RepID=A0A9N9G6I8_9GLOM|nr:18996_t:CDS:2 [Dentiscutata erythropus]
MTDAILNELGLDELALVYNPPYNLEQLVSTRTSGSARKNGGHPPRPPNCFFLLKNAIMLVASLVWEKAPEDVKSLYCELSKEALKLHAAKYPHYKFKPKKRQVFKAYNPHKREGSLDVPKMVPAPSPSSPTLLSPPLTPPLTFPVPEYFYFSAFPAAGPREYTADIGFHPGVNGVQELYLNLENPWVFKFDNIH